MNIAYVAEFFVAIECYGTALLQLLLTCKPLKIVLAQEQPAEVQDPVKCAALDYAVRYTTALLQSFGLWTCSSSGLSEIQNQRKGHPLHRKRETFARLVQVFLFSFFFFFFAFPSPQALKIK